MVPIRSRMPVGRLFGLLSLVLLAIGTLRCEKAFLVATNLYTESLAELVHQTSAWSLSTMTNNAPEAEAVGTIFGHIFKLTERAEKWSFWHQNAALSRDDVSCEWTAFKPFGRPENNTTQMCTYPVATDRFVSVKIKNDGRWYDCDDLVGLWKEATGRHASLASSDKTMIYLDLGGNIGSCVMEMLHSTDAKIVVFEPHPHNLAQLTTTIHGLAQQLRNRVVIFPIGVGDVTGNFTMHMASNNRGNSVVGQAIKDAPSQNFLNSTSIFVERLNDIFNADKVVIPLMKMDIQGFECKAWDGMSSLLPAVDIIKTEAERKFLIGQGCSPQELRKRISKVGFTFNGRRLNIIARRNSPLQTLANTNESVRR